MDANQPSNCSAYICNLNKHAVENKKILESRSMPKIINRVISPRFEMAGLCSSHKSYETPLILPHTSTHDAMTIQKIPSNQVHNQLADLIHVESYLSGYHRPSTHNFKAHPKAMSGSYADSLQTSPVVRIRHLPFTQNTTDTSMYNLDSRCNSSFASRSPDTYKECPRMLGTVQTRSPTMQDAPWCPQPPHTSDEAHWWHWKGSLPEARKESWRWNDHPYELNINGVARVDHSLHGSNCVQDLHLNSTRRKLTSPDRIHLRNCTK